MDTYTKLDRKASNIVTKLQNYVTQYGYKENLGQKELRDFESEVRVSNLTYQEKYQLIHMATIAIQGI